MNLTAGELRQLRYRLGWSIADMGRRLKIDMSDLAIISQWEAGAAVPSDEQRNLLINIMSQAETNAECVQRRPIAEVAMRKGNLNQIHNFDLLDSDDDMQTLRAGKA